MAEQTTMAVEAGDEEWIDITSVVEEAANSLTVSDPMLCDRNSFNLQDAMAALELMDKTMDCCEIPASQVAPFGVKADDEKFVFPRPSPTGLEDVVNPLPWEDLTMLDAAHISLQNLIRLESLLDGASVVESTYTCLYAHLPVIQDMKARLEPSSLTEQIQAIMKSTMRGSLAQHVVYASTLLLVEVTDTVRSIILNADIYEEEDFTVSTYNIKTFKERDEYMVTTVASNILEMIEELDNQDSDEVQAIKLIFQFQLDFLSICTSLARLSGTVVRDAVEESQKKARNAIVTLGKISDVVKRMEETKSDSVRALIQRTFDSNVNRPLVGNAPVRKVIFKNPLESVETFITTTKDFDSSLCRLMLKGNTLGRIRRMLSTISISSVNILIRSLIVLNLYFDDMLLGQHSLSGIIVKNIQQLSLAPNEVFATPYVEAFLNRLAKPVYDVLKVLTLNRNRQRSYIEAVMFHDWSALFHEANLVDTTYKKDNPEAPLYFSIYVLTITIHLMDHYVSLGLELDLFCGEHEVGVAYWYRDFLLSSLISQISSMRQVKTAHKQAMIQYAESKAPAKQQRGKKKASKQQKKNSNGSSNTPSLVAATAEDMEDEFEFLLLNLKRGLCRGIVRVSGSEWRLFYSQHRFAFSQYSVCGFLFFTFQKVSCCSKSSRSCQGDRIRIHIQRKNF